MSIEELDEPSDSYDRAVSPLGVMTRIGRRRASAAIAGLVIGMAAYTATSLAAGAVGLRVRDLPRDAPPATATAICEPTMTRDASGVITVDGNIGIVGETFTRGGEGSFLIVRRGAIVGELASLQFTQIGTSAPATWVQYGASAGPQPTRTPWGDRAAFSAGWKPIAFENSCWRLIVDGRDSGIVLRVGPG